MLLIFISSIITSLNLGFIGPFILWRKITSLGDALAHSLILVGSLQYFLNLDPIYISIILSFFFSIISVYISDNKNDNNLYINILSSLFVGISIVISEIYDIRSNIENILFGDILSITYTDLYFIIITFIFSFSYSIINFKEIILSIFSEELAYVEGINVKRIKLINKIIITINIAIAIKLIGVLLMSAVSLIPSAISKEISDNPKHMIIKTMLIACFASVTSLFISYNYDIPYSAISVILLSIGYISLKIYKELFMLKH